MLTWGDVERQCADGRLVKWLPSVRTETKEGDRCLYMLKPVFDQFQTGKWPSSVELRPSEENARRRTMRMVLERYVTGKFLNLKYDMKELGSGTERSEVMRGFWEFRSGPPAEQTRLFGFFARPGCFIATSFKARGTLPKGLWVEEKSDSEKIWASLWPNDIYLKKPWIVSTKAEFSAYLDREDD